MNKDIKRYIKLLSTVPETFVDELFDMYGEDTTQTDFVISLTHVAKWLRCSKKELIQTVRKSYKHDIDYKILKVPARVPYANNTKEYIVTPDCFKRLCMLSRAKNAELVRTYFIEIESLMIKYRTQLIAGIQQDIKNINKQKKIRTSIVKNQGYTYIIRSSMKRKELYKVGQTKDFHKRLQAYQTGKMEDVEVVFAYKTNDHVAVEKCVKALADKYQVESRKEIYHLNLDMLKEIMTGCGKLSMKLEHRMRGASQVGGEYYVVLAK